MHQGGGKVADPLWSGILRTPGSTEELARRAAAEQLARALEPAADAEVVVGPGKVADDQRHEVEAGSDLVRSRTAPGQIAAHTGRGNPEKPCELITAQHAVYAAPFGGRRGRRIERFIELSERNRRELYTILANGPSSVMKYMCKVK